MVRLRVLTFTFTALLVLPLRGRHVMPGAASLADSELAGESKSKASTEDSSRQPTERAASTSEHSLQQVHIVRGYDLKTSPAQHDEDRTAAAVAPLAPTASEETSGVPGHGAAIAEAYRDHRARGEQTSAPTFAADKRVAMHALLEVITRALPVAPALAAILAVGVAEGQKRFAMDTPDHIALTSMNSTAGQTPMDVSNTSWLQRMQDALILFVIGIILIIFSFPVLWFNERRAARMDSVIARGRDEVQTISASVASEENRGKLVFVQGGHMQSAGEVQDRRFEVTMKNNCVRLQSYVEVFQNIEHEHKQTRNNSVGGGSQTTTAYSYTTEWTSMWHDSSNFRQKDKVNVKPSLLTSLGNDVATCDRVEYGSGFILDEVLVRQCTVFEPVQDLAEFVPLRFDSSTKLRKSSEDETSPWYYLRIADPNWSGEGRSQIGDTRVKFEVIRDGPATVVALQGDNDPIEASKGRFLPYRLIARPWCGRSSPDDEVYKRRLLAEGTKSSDDLANDEKCNFVACCCCNLVAMCCALLTPEIHHIILGSLDVPTCFRTIESQNKATTRGIRVVGWLMMLLGLILFFAPLTTLILIIPFLGPILSNVGQFAIVVFGFIVTLAISSLIVVLAYAVYRPFAALLYAIVGAVIVAIPIFVLRAMKA